MSNQDPIIPSSSPPPSQQPHLPKIPIHDLPRPQDHAQAILKSKYVNAVQTSLFRVRYSIQHNLISEKRFKQSPQTSTPNRSPKRQSAIGFQSQVHSDHTIDLNDKKTKQNQFQTLVHSLPLYYQYFLSSNQFDLSNPQCQKAVLDILQKPKRKTENEIQILFRMIQNLPFFKDHKELLSLTTASKELLQSLSLEYYPKYSEIFEKGDIGDKFYILVTGSAYCLLDQKQASPEEFKVTRQFIRDMVGVKVKTKEFEKRIQDIYGIDRPDKPNIDQESEVIKAYMPSMLLAKIYLAGDSFGEIALITQQPRAATIITRSDSYIVTLNKEAYTNMLGSYEKIILRDRINFLMKFAFFQFHTFGQLLGVLHFIEIHSFSKNHIIYQEGDSDNRMYFIKSGEVEISKNYDIDSLLESSITDEVNQDLTEWKNQRTKSLYRLNKSISQKNTASSIVRLHLVGLTNYAYFGEEEPIKHISIRTTKAVVTSSSAEIFSIDATKLLQDLQNHQTLTTLISHSEQKRQNLEPGIQKKIQIAMQERKSIILSGKHFHQQKHLHQSVSSTQSGLTTSSQTQKLQEFKAKRFHTELPPTAANSILLQTGHTTNTTNNNNNNNNNTNVSDTYYVMAPPNEQSNHRLPIFNTVQHSPLSSSSQKNNLNYYNSASRKLITNINENNKNNYNVHPITKQSTTTTTSQKSHQSSLISNSSTSTPKNILPYFISQPTAATPTQRQTTTTSTSTNKSSNHLKIKQPYQHKQQHEEEKLQLPFFTQSLQVSTSHDRITPSLLKDRNQSNGRMEEQSETQKKPLISLNLKRIIQNIESSSANKSYSSPNNHLSRLNHLHFADPVLQLKQFNLVSRVKESTPKSAQENHIILEMPTKESNNPQMLKQQQWNQQHETLPITEEQVSSILKQAPYLNKIENKKYEKSIKTSSMSAEKIHYIKISKWSKHQQALSKPTKKPKNKIKVSEELLPIPVETPCLIAHQVSTKIPQKISNNKQNPKAFKTEADSYC